MLCHKPCTVSGGGKSEISKSLASIILKGPVFVGDFQHDFDRVEEVLQRDFSTIYTGASRRGARGPPDPERRAVARVGHQAPDAVE